MKGRLEITDLHVTVDDKEVLKGFTLTVEPGETVALMGPNGSGKSTLANVIMGHPGYEVTGGTMTYDGHDLAGLEPEERARLGLFLSFQHPVEIPGLVVQDYLKQVVETKRGERVRLLDFKRLLKQRLEELDIDASFVKRYLNEGFSGGEKKRMEILQLALLEPRMAVLDETDSGLDIDALKSVAKGVNLLMKDGMGVLAITHYKRLLDHLKPDRVAIMKDGKVVREGGPDLADKLEAEGYSWIEE
ncbi:Fe-S cluster assembly ATPase SufC [Candidatus Woesearchaeota archaeon]|nr:Fe-S cluster assembly ATPase SufC [Candidatus Woesearchaeota archaeon]